MSDTLTQAEIDALRAAVKSGTAIEEAAAPVAAPTTQIKVIDYDFRKPHLMASDQHHTLQVMHEALGKQFQAALLTSVKTGAEVKLVAVDQISYGEFILSLTNPTYMAALSTKPNIGAIVMQIDVPVVMAISDILLGGTGKTPTDVRELTMLELRIFSSITSSLLKELSAAWLSLVEVSFEVASQESNPQYMQVATPETVCQSMTYDIRIGEVTGILTLCYPFDVIQAILAAAEKRSGKRTVSAAGDDAMLRAILDVPLAIHVVIGGGPIPAHELAQLEPGDLLCLNRRIDAPLEVYLGENPIFMGIPGKYKGKAAVVLK
ncbi:MAG: FliM/FliN family flagellar motor switch protein [bacterium]